MAGFAGYGLCGGGLGIYDLATEQATLIPHEQIIPYHSTLTLKALPNGDLIGGTSIETPGGGHPKAKEGVLYTMDWETRQVVFQTVPVPGAAEVLNIEIGPDRRVYGLTSGSTFFVFDPNEKKVIHREDLSAYGDVSRHRSLVCGSDERLYAAFTNAIVSIEPDTFRHEKLATPPALITAGIALHKRRLYFASRSQVWSYGLASRGVHLISG